MGKIGSVCVIGGGIAGMQASLDLADSGFKVYLIESSPSIGGKMSQLDKTFPTMDCSICIQSPKMVEVGRHPNIELLTYSELTSVSGSEGNFHLDVLKKSRYVDLEKCTGCGECTKVCLLKNKILNEFDVETSKRGAIYVPFPQAVPLKALIDSNRCIYLTKGKCGNGPACVGVCDAQAINFEEKDEVMKIDVGAIILSPGYDLFNNISKRYLPDHPDVVTSLQFERLVCASGPMKGHLVRPSNGEKPKRIGFIQCVGSRCEENEPCSSVCCVYATKEAIIVKEHEPDVEIYIFYIDIRAFGKGFEEFVVRAEEEYGINYIKSSVSEITEKEGRLTVRFEDTKESGIEEMDLDIVVLSNGLVPSKSTEKLADICGVELNDYGYFKTSLSKPMETNVSGIYVCGAAGGPIDIPDSVAQSSGAAVKASSLLHKERNKLVVEEEYPPEIKIEGEPRVGVFVCHCGINIGGVVNVPEVVEYAKTLPNVVYTNENLYTCSQETNEIIKNAIKEQNLNRVVVAACTPRTHEPLFQNTCAEAGLNPYLFDFANIRDQCSWVHMNDPQNATEKAKDLVRMSVAKARLLSPLERQKVPITQKALVIGGGISGITAALDIANQEIPVYLVEKEKELGGFLRSVKRLHNGEKSSDLLNDLVKKVKENGFIEVFTGSEVKNVEGYVGNFKADIISGDDGSKTEIDFGASVIAIGGDELKPDEYEYGKDKNVVTQLEFEKILEDGIDAKNIVMIQCVGSRNDERPYCSRVCCTEAVKNALRIKDQNSDSNVFVLHRDIRTYGVLETMYKEALYQGVVFVRFEKKDPPSFENGVISVHDSLLNKKIQIEPDLVVLSTASVSKENGKEIGGMFKVPLDKNGFFFEAHVKLRPVDFATDGVFLCGAAHFPKLIEECIAQASGAASRACRVLSRKDVETEGIVSTVDENRCVGCGVCEEVCPYGAISVKDNVAEVTAVLCKGCGCCGSSCIRRAITMQHFSDEQLISQARAAMEVM
ncbi:MAG: CoB--CoM heterodisulfide reductase iron-sulfur subunit A family protein [Halobacteriota archaeon]|nr:CoB--CoM heterodisulfide reductase iron-sulfur subunit A family protein [Halobacteriota archaeon]